MKSRVVLMEVIVTAPVHSANVHPATRDLSVNKVRHIVLQSLV